MSFLIYSFGSGSCCCSDINLAMWNFGCLSSF